MSKKMLVSDFGRFAQTAKERRALLHEYTEDSVNHFYFCVCDMQKDGNTKREKGTEYRRAILDNANRIDRMKYKFCHTIGTEWMIIKVSSSTIGDLSAEDYTALFDTKYRVKATNRFYAVMKKLLSAKKAKIIYRSNNYVLDLWEYYLQEDRNFGYAIERFLFGVSNRNVKDKKDGILGKYGIQVKCSFTLYRVKEEEKSDKTGFYRVGTGKGVSTSNGI